MQTSSLPSVPSLHSMRIATRLPGQWAVAPQFGMEQQEMDQQEEVAAVATHEADTSDNSVPEWLKIAITPLSIMTGGYLLNNSLRSSLHSKIDIIKNELQKGFSALPASTPTSTGGKMANFLRDAAASFVGGGVGILLVLGLFGRRGNGDE
jgi:hypothetical protein